jgi:ketosteroid isomerase-like protein
MRGRGGALAKPGCVLFHVSRSGRLRGRDLSITADGDVAFCRSLNRISGTRTDGEETDVWVRATVGLRRIDGSWQVTHEHSSLPFYRDGSYRAAVDLVP